MFDQKELQIEMSSVMPFTFNGGELCVVTINEKPWIRTSEVCSALEYDAKTSKKCKHHKGPLQPRKDHPKVSIEHCTCCMYTNQLAKGFAKIRYLHQ